MNKLALATCVVATLSSVAFAASPAPRSSIVSDPFRGALRTSIPIDVPAFHGLEPALVLAYSSSGGSGLAGVGWDLGGFSSIERASPGQGAPRYDGSDVFVLDGQELVACASGIVSPSCAAGGTHAPKIESYQRVAFSSTTNTWTVTRGDGVKQVYAAVYGVSRGTFRWGIQYVQDTMGNRVDYTWACAAGDCYPSSVAYGPYRVAIHREQRPDVRTFANGESIGATSERIRAILVEATGVTPIRAYRLSYAAVAAARRSQLVAVQEYGRDVVIDGAGAITGGTALPAASFAYQGDPAAGTFTLAPGPTPAPAGTVEDVAWFKKRCSASSGSALWKSQPDCPGSAWNAGGSSTRAIASGDGYMQFADGSLAWWHGEVIAGLSNNDALASGDDIDYGLQLVEDPVTRAHTLYVVERGVRIAEVGDWTSSSVLRVAVENGKVVYRRDGIALLPPRPGAPTYPLRASAALRDPVSGITNVAISGAMVDLAGWCVDGTRSQGDYNGDGRADLLCKEGDTVRVRLGNGAGFGPPVIWLTASLPYQGQGDFDGDGKTDLYGIEISSGDFRVALSTGAGFAAPVSWTPHPVCRLNEQQFRVTTGDFNGDGRTDVVCQRTAGDASDGAWVGLSTGARFVHSRWLAACGLDHVALAVDLDGDGRDDLACIDGAGAVDVNLSTGSAFDGAALIGSYILAGNCDWSRWQVGDFNADGKADFACANSGRVWLSAGRRLLAQAASSAFCPGEHDQLLTGDVDGDGLSDWICKYDAGSIEVRLGTGTGFAAATTWLASWCLGNVVAADLDGDRKTDLYCDEAVRQLARAGTPGTIPDVMTAATNATGGTTTIAYAPSSTFPNVNNPPVVPVVVATTASDGRGGSATTTYAYDGGLIDRQQRRFLGFAHQREIEPCSAAPCPRRDIYLAQDYGSLSKIRRDEHRDGRGRLLDVVENELTTNGAAVPYTSLLTGTWHHAYAGSGPDDEPFHACKGDVATCRTTYATHEYDSYGNVRRTVEHGDIALDGDERRVERQFYPNTAAFIVDRPGWETWMSGTVSGELLQQTIFLYDGSSIWGQPPQQGRLTGTLRWHDATNSFVQAAMAYDAYGNSTSTIDETGLATTTAYDDATHLFPVRVTNPAGEAMVTAWDPVCQQPVQITDANAQVTAMTYDALCRITRRDRPLGAYEITRYVATGDPANQRTEVVTPLPAGSAQQTKATYVDGFGRVVRTTARGPMSGILVEQTTTYGVDGTIAAKSAPYYTGDAPAITRYTHDALGRTTATELPDGTRLATSYGAWSETAVDAHGHATTSRSDAYGRLLEREQTIGGAAAITAHGYDPMGHLVSMSDPAGNRWSWTFDTLGRLAQQLDPDAGARRFEYDAAGRTTLEVDARGQQILSTYVAGRLASRTSADGTVAFQYGPDLGAVPPGFANVGRLTAMSDTHGVERRDYDALGCIVRTTRRLDGSDYVLERRYAPSGDLLGTTFPDGDAIGTAAQPLVYDRAGRLSAIPGIVDEIRYDAAGRPVNQTNANHTVMTATYDVARGLPLTLVTTGPSSVQNLTYHYDASGLAVAVDSPFAHESHTYAYDDAHRLVGATDLGDHTRDETYTYDVAGNMTWSSRVGPYTYPAPGTPHPHAPATIAGVAQTYDAAGRLLAGSARTITWTADGKPLTVNASTYRYDGNGARLHMQTGASTSLWPVGDDYEINDGTITKYVRTPFGVVASRTGATTFWLHRDHLGSINAVTNAAGAVVKRTAFTGYGDILAMTGDHPEPRDYIGERRDGATALLHLHARSYDARTAQFLSPDPSLPTLAGVGTNRYAYAGGDPMNRLDPSGLGWCLGWSRVDTDGRDGHEGKWEPYWYECNPNVPVDLIHGPFPAGPDGPDGCLRLHTCREPPPKPQEPRIKKPPPPKEPPPWEPDPVEQCLFWLGENCKYWDDRKHRRPEHVHPNPEDEIKPPDGIPQR